ncbi:Uu.00g029560.m01.CDS01 [Anthostomella pinea]|uniref:Uu.00g029560.m01.CDS01 n=1 Tax=Anthostomella pinea TaxID=933095 RepID=A0AAI8YD14_9PEZI|nr:Uu.00g029560.m01.CDS01 [Anthostomella pinea]
MLHISRLADSLDLKHTAVHARSTWQFTSVGFLLRRLLERVDEHLLDQYG